MDCHMETCTSKRLLTETRRQLENDLACGEARCWTSVPWFHAPSSSPRHTIPSFDFRFSPWSTRLSFLIRWYLTMFYSAKFVAVPRASRHISFRCLGGIATENRLPHRCAVCESFPIPGGSRLAVSSFLSPQCYLQVVTRNGNRASRQTLCTWAGQDGHAMRPY